MFDENFVRNHKTVTLKPSITGAVIFKGSKVLEEFLLGPLWSLEDDFSAFLQYVGNLLPSDTALYFRTESST